jgi:hypothetical protein
MPNSVGVLVRIATVVGLLVALGACSNDADKLPTSPTSASPTSVVRTSASQTLDCNDPIGELSTPGDGYEAIDGAVALPTSAANPIALGTSATREYGPSKRLFAKTGLLVRTGVKSELITPPEWIGRLWYRWGNTGPPPPTDHFVVGPCRGAAAWIAFPGGFFVADPACVHLVVRTAAGDHDVTVGVGAPCPGQRPPPDPTDA